MFKQYYPLLAERTASLIDNGAPSYQYFTSKTAALGKRHILGGIAGFGALKGLADAFFRPNATTGDIFANMGREGLTSLGGIGGLMTGYALAQKLIRSGALRSAAVSNIANKSLIRQGSVNLLITLLASLTGSALGRDTGRIADRRIFGLPPWLSESKTAQIKTAIQNKNIIKYAAAPSSKHISSIRKALLPGLAGFIGEIGAEELAAVVYNQLTSDGSNLTSPNFNRGLAKGVSAGIGGFAGLGLANTAIAQKMFNNSLIFRQLAAHLGIPRRNMGALRQALALIGGGVAGGELGHTISNAMFNKENR